MTPPHVASQHSTRMLAYAAAADVTERLVEAEKAEKEKEKQKKV